ncbi:MAG TPA: palindromic element RPE4 domain-containing protein [Rickettsia endosymbiont of Omalisus fontisbellaquei]|nr:palindromic element RPE4 domain-containing protein [Rickettsia endosymbiont of Omalisus fontisbellaquei]
MFYCFLDTVVKPRYDTPNAFFDPRKQALSRNDIITQTITLSIVLYLQNFLYPLNR